MLRRSSTDTVPPASSRDSGIRNFGAEETDAVVDARADARIELLEMALHDLQAPVAILDVSMRLLTSDLEQAPIDVKDTLRDARRATRRIRQYIDHLVVSERLSRGALEPRRTQVDVGIRLEELADEYEGHAKLVNADFEVDIDDRADLTMQGDEVLLQRIFQNLLENALRHVRAGGRVLVSARKESVIEVRIANDGPRIPAVQHERLFGKFSVGGRERTTPGIGLYFCKLAVEAHRGTIVLEEDPDWPVCFVVRLPVAALQGSGSPSV